MGQSNHDNALYISNYYIIIILYMNIHSNLFIGLDLGNILSDT